MIYIYIYIHIYPQAYSNYYSSYIIHWTRHTVGPQVHTRNPSSRKPNSLLT